jgi:hypothetical protein
VIQSALGPFLEYLPVKRTHNCSKDNEACTLLYKQLPFIGHWGLVLDKNEYRGVPLTTVPHHSAVETLNRICAFLCDLATTT